MPNVIPEKIGNFNVYDDTEKLMGLTGEITLPNLEAMTETISGAGMLGEIDSANPGHFGSLSIEIPFRVLYQKSFSLLKYTGRNFYLRANQQSYDATTGRLVQSGVKITLRTAPKGLNLGKFANGASSETTNTLEILYIKIEVAGVVVLELDKLNFVYIVDGEDMLADIKKYI
ncbi:phage tail protein [Bacillus infantis]|uniref:Phage tail protein n=1 Tax=Bacillus infantis TaxID=324767 RepID=A0A5D4SUH1_9BACI|nr:phage major tail tube protein [Bacillus infantis]TYS66371.1 phage tail protein [Bacillus infantis]